MFICGGEKLIAIDSYGIMCVEMTMALWRSSQALAFFGALLRQAPNITPHTIWQNAVATDYLREG